MRMIFMFQHITFACRLTVLAAGYRDMQGMFSRRSPTWTGVVATLIALEARINAHPPTSS
jgi:hypothetical protein